MLTTETRLLTAGDLLRLYGGGARGELIRGLLCETMATGQRHGRIVMNLGAALRSFAKLRRLGTLVGSEQGWPLIGAMYSTASSPERSRPLRRPR